MSAQQYARENHPFVNFLGKSNLKEYKIFTRVVGPAEQCPTNTPKGFYSYVTKSPKTRFRCIHFFTDENIHLRPHVLKDEEVISETIVTRSFEDPTVEEVYYDCEDNSVAQLPSTLDVVEFYDCTCTSSVLPVQGEHTLEVPEMEDDLAVEAAINEGFPLPPKTVSNYLPHKDDAVLYGGDYKTYAQPRVESPPQKEKPSYSALDLMRAVLRSSIPLRSCRRMDVMMEEGVPELIVVKGHSSETVCASCHAPMPEVDETRISFQLNHFCRCKMTAPATLALRPEMKDEVQRAVMVLNYTPAFHFLPFGIQEIIAERLGTTINVGEPQPLVITRIGDPQTLFLIFCVSGLHYLRVKYHSMRKFAVVLLKHLLPRCIVPQSFWLELIRSCARAGVIDEVHGDLKKNLDYPLGGDMAIRMLPCATGRDKVEAQRKAIQQEALQLWHTPRKYADPLYLERFPERAQAADDLPAIDLKIPRKIAQLDQKMARGLTDVALADEIWEPIREVFRGVISNLPPLSPRVRESLIQLHLYYFVDSHVSTALLASLMMGKIHMSVDEVMILDFFHALYFTVSFLYHRYLRWRQCKPTERAQAEDVGLLTSTVNKITNVFLPGEDSRLYSLLCTKLRFLSQLKCVAWDILTFFKWTISVIVEYLWKEKIHSREAVQSFLERVDTIEEIWKDDEGNTGTLRADLTKSKKSRLELLSILSTGRQLLRSLERSELDKASLQPLKDRVRKLEKIVSGNQASFVGCEGKIKPYTFYIWGAPGTGKTVMVQHLAHDLCQVLKEPDFDKSRDIYSIMANTPYHDQYAYQRFAVFNDIFQMKDEDYRNTEIFNIIQMTDESPYPLNIAECSGKGTIYFSSPFVVLTSNFDLEAQRPELESRMESPDAVLRRMNVFIHVSQPRLDPHKKGFQRDAVRCEVRIQGSQYQAVSWWELLRILRDDVLDKMSLSSAINAIAPTEAELAVLREISLENDVVEDDEPQPGPSRPLRDEDLIDKAQASDDLPVIPLRERCAMIKRWVMREEMPRFHHRVLAGHTFPWMCVSRDARLYCEMYDKVQGYLKWAKIFLGVTSAWAGLTMLHSLLTKLFGVEEKAQGVILTSGGSYEAPTRAGRRKRNEKFKQFHFDRAQSGDSVWKSANGALVQSKVVRNMAMVWNGTRRLNGVFLYGHVILIPHHLFRDVDEDVITIVVSGTMSVSIDMSELLPSEVIVSEEHQLVILNLHEHFRNYPAFFDLRSYFIKQEELAENTEKGFMATLRHDVNTNAIVYHLPITNIRVAKAGVRINDEGRATTFNLAQSVTGTVASNNGDCGSLWVADRGLGQGAKILGAHVSGIPETMMGRATLMTKEMVDETVKYFSYGEPRPAVSDFGTQSLVDDWGSAPEVFQSVDIQGKSAIDVPQASKTKLRHTLWRGVRPQKTHPAHLRPFTGEDGNQIVPQRVNFAKYAGKRVFIPKPKIEQACQYLGDWYPRPAKKWRKVLSLEDAIFGSQDGENPSINSDAAIGLPWCKKFKSRRELVKLGERWVHPDLEQAVNDLMENPDQPIYIIDGLKDERLSERKWKAGDTRVFTILPIHVNIVLKMLLGDFVHYLQRNFQSCPVKIGISPLPNDWTRLYNYLHDNRGQLIAGDYKGWDRTVHMEVLMTIVDWVNDWYDDEYGEIRHKLIKRVLSAYHILNGTLYQSRAGMPSGSYLTTPFNSLANLVYFYLYLIDNKVPMDHHCSWFVPAIYGDDHVIAVTHHSTINMITYAEWCDKYGLRYTDVDKNKPTVPYVTWDEVTFLKRKFVKREGLVYAPLPTDQLYEMVQWCHLTPAVKRMTERELVTLIFEVMMNELVFHPREIYEGVIKELLDYARDVHAKDFSGCVTSYDRHRRKFLDEGRQAIMTTFAEWHALYPLVHEKAQAIDEEKTKAVTQEDLRAAMQVEGTVQRQTEPLLEARLVQDTVLTDPVEQVETSAISYYQDAQNRVAITQGQVASNIVDANLIFPEGYFSACERSLPIGSFTLPGVTPQAFPLYRLDIVNNLMARPFISEKLSYARFIRYDLEIQIRVLSTNFHYGQIMAVFRPAYFPFMKVKITEGGQSTLRVDLLEDAWNPAGPYDPVYTASQLKNTIIPVTAGTSVTIDVPWGLNLQYVRTRDALTPRSHFGFLDIYALTPIGPTGIDHAQFQVFGRLKNIKGFGYQNNPDGVQVRPRWLQYFVHGQEQPDWRIEFPHPTRGPTIPMPELGGGGDGTGWWDIGQLKQHGCVARWNGTKGKPIPPSPTHEIAQAEDADNIDQQGGQLSRVTGVGAKVLSSITQALSQLGLSKPLVRGPPEKVVNVAPGITNSVGPDVTYSTAYDAANMMVQPCQHPPETDISRLAAIPTYMGFWTFTNKQNTKQIALSPATVRVGKWNDVFCCMPATYIASRFVYWRGGLRYKIHFSSSSFINARFVILAGFEYNDMQAGISPTQYVEVKGDAVVEGVIPFLHVAPWAVLKQQVVQFRLKVSLLDSAMVAWKVDQAEAIYASLWCSFDNFQVAQPGDPVDLAIPWGYGYYFDGEHPVEKSQAEDEPIPGAMRSGEVVSAGMNDIPTSVYHVAKRCQLNRSCVITGMSAMPLVSDGKLFAGYYAFSYNPSQTYFAALFRWQAGSVEALTGESSYGIDVPFMGKAYDMLIHDSASIGDMKEQVMMGGCHPTLMKMGEAFIAMRQPYRSNMMFVSGPHLVWWWTGDIGYQGCHFAPMNSYYEPYEGIQGIWLGDINNSKPHLAAWSFGDDLIYNQFMGVPALVVLKHEDLATALYGPA